MPYCGNCGAEVPEGQKFCGNCGAEVAGAAAVRPEAVARTPFTSKPFPWKILIAAVIALIVVGIGVLFILAATGTAEIPVLSPLFASPTPTPTPTPRPSPADAARDFWQALAELDVDRMKELTCAAYQEEMEAAFGFAELGDLEELRDILEIDVSDLQFAVVSESGDDAVVRVYGTLKMSFLGQEESEQMDEEIELVMEHGEWKVCGGE
jgi:hypothetical protein